MPTTLTPRQTKAIGLLGAGMNKTDTAQECGISRETLHQWLRQDDFNAALRDLHRRQGRLSFSRALSLVDDALATLSEIMTDPEQDPRCRVAAASKLLSFASTTFFDLDSEERLMKVEQELGLREKPKAG